MTYDKDAARRRFISKNKAFHQHTHRQARTLEQQKERIKKFITLWNDTNTYPFVRDVEVAMLPDALNASMFATQLRKLGIPLNDRKITGLLSLAARALLESEELKKTYIYRRKKLFAARLKKSCLEKDNYRCVKCGSVVNLEVDHIQEIIDGGDNSISNLQTLCHICHLEKTIEQRKLRTKK
jgi:hypothetical protein